MSLYSINMVPVPMDAETYEGKNNEYSLIEVEYKYMAVTHIIYLPLTEQQLQLCTKWGPIYYCKSTHLLRDKNVPSCASAIYYDAKPVIKIKHCKSKYIKSSHLEPNILDGRQNLILSNLPKPWTLVCGAQNRPFPLKYSTLRIINRTELCEYSLTAGTFYITQTVKSCSLTNILSDGTFITYYVFNKIIFDTLAEKYQILPDKNIQDIMSNLLQEIPVNNWKLLNWFNSSNDNNILEDTEIVQEDWIGYTHWYRLLFIGFTYRYSSHRCRKSLSWSRHQKLQEDWIGYTHWYRLLFIGFTYRYSSHRCRKSLSWSRHQNCKRRRELLLSV